MQQNDLQGKQTFVFAAKHPDTSSRPSGENRATWWDGRQWLFGGRFPCFKVAQTAIKDKGL